MLVTCLQETKLGVNCSIKDFTDYANIRRDRRMEAVVDLSPSSTIPSPIGCLMETFFQTMLRRRSWRLRMTLEGLHWPLSMFKSPRNRPASGTTPLTLTRSWRTIEIWWYSATSTPTIPLGSTGQEITGQRLEGKRFMRPSTVCNLRLRTWTCPLTPLAGPAFLVRYYPFERASPPRRDVVNPHHPCVWPSPSIVIPRLHRGRFDPTRVSARLNGRDLQQS